MTAHGTDWHVTRGTIDPPLPQIKADHAGRAPCFAGGMVTTTLRTRFLAALAASGVAYGLGATGCGGAVEGTGGSSGSSGASSGGSSSGGSSGGQTSPPGTGTGTPTSPPLAASCQYGRPETACYTRDELLSQWNNPGRGGDAADAGAKGDPPWDANGCLPAADVRNSCCNVAVAGPKPDGAGKCCYIHCAGACCGRPFVVAGETRVASVVERSDWLVDESSRLSGSEAALDAFTRDRIANAWTRDAAMEHASIAAFARFTLELLAHGAPAELLLGAQDATREEIEHARACFAIATRYAGRAIGPSVLDVDGTGAMRPLADVVAAVVVEGCIGETLSAVLAEVRRARAKDSDVRAALGRIAEEEARHAELAWRFVGWAIATGGDAVRTAARSAFETADRAPPHAFDASLRGIPAATLRAHGLLDETTARAAAAQAMHETVAPCAAALGDPPSKSMVPEKGDDAADADVSAA